MKAILMAAGRGSRISRHIGDLPKCTLDIGGTTLIEHTVDMLVRHDIDVSIIVGYHKEAIQDVLAPYPVTFYVNPFYDVTNSIASLWFARKELLQDDLILANADVYWDEDLLQILLDEQETPVMLGDSSRKEEGDYLFKWDDTFRLLDHGKDLKRPNITGEYVGIAKLLLKDQAAFNERMEAMIMAQKHQVWWENVLYETLDQNRIHVRDIAPLFWGEVDYIEDYSRICAYRRKKGLTDLNPTEAWN